TGLVYAFDKLSLAVPRTSTTLFLRDNIFRSIQHFDTDYSRNIEGYVLRLHWDEYHLFNMICSRLRAAFGITIEKNLRVWDSVTARDIKGKAGFRHCLRLTLYRPRDLLVLLNHAFYHACSHDRDTIVNEDIEVAARQISCTRLDDLKKEYGEVIPGITHLLSLFANNKPELSLAQVTSLIDSDQLDEPLGPAECQTLAIIRSPTEIIHTLFSVGFLGIWNCTTSSYVFCHDGKDPDFAVDTSSKVLIHPCYWIALNIEDRTLTTEVDEIHDDYDIEVRSETPEIRKRKVGSIISQLNAISEGDADAAKFEKWCLEAIQIVFAGGIVNIELHPNKILTQRRDVVGRNTELTETWKRIFKDYQTRQVVFEVKNYSKDLGPDEYRQMLSYLCKEHGRLGFIINRSKDANIQKDRELRWVREIYHEHQRVVVKLPCTLIVKWLSKLRNPQKHDAPDKGLGALLDNYERLYLRLGDITKKKRNKV
ncbi:P-loop ATPase, Sll1717 family, partial [Acidobacteriota bacterium]